MVAAMPLRTVEATTVRGPAPTPQPPEPRPRKRLLLVAGVGLALLTVLLLVNRSSNNSDKVSATKSTSTTGPDGAAGVAAPQIAGPGGAAGNGSKPAWQATKPPGARAAAAQNIPLDIKVSNTQNLRDGDVVHVHITPKKGSLAYGLEARQCQGGTTYSLEADMRPTIAGKCVSRPLSSRSDDYVAAKGAPPYASVDLDYRVGTGTNTYQTQAGRAPTVACGASNPCTLVLELQFPDGYGLETIPLTFR
jgi:hypothetical protein